jgi:tetratricopeptide (TPR) repeat protein
MQKEVKARVKVKGRFIAVVLGLSVALVAGVIFATNQWSSSRDAQVAQLDRLMVGVGEITVRNPIQLTDAQQEEALQLKRSSVKYIRNAATMLLAQAAYVQGDVAGALSLYEEVAGQKKGYMVPKAQLSVAYMHLALQDRAKAYAMLEQLLKSDADAMNVDMQYEAEILMAYLYESDDLPRALGIYRNVLAMLDSQNLWYMIAQARLLYFDAFSEAQGL